jgi:hypothetical protein
MPAGLPRSTARRPERQHHRPTLDGHWLRDAGNPSARTVVGLDLNNHENADRAFGKDGIMARQKPKAADPRRKPGEQPETGSSDWYGGERENEFGGEGRFRAGGGHGSHFGGEPDALGDNQQANTRLRRSERAERDAKAPWTPEPRTRSER